MMTCYPINMDKETQTFLEMHAPAAILLISCYKLGLRRIGLTHPFNALEAARFSTDTIDIEELRRGNNLF